MFRPLVQTLARPPVPTKIADISRNFGESIRGYWSALEPRPPFLSGENMSSFLTPAGITIALAVAGTTLGCSKSQPATPSQLTPTAQSRSVLASEAPHEALSAATSKSWRTRGTQPPSTTTSNERWPTPVGARTCNPVEPACQPISRSVWGRQSPENGSTRWCSSQPR